MPPTRKRVLVFAPCTYNLAETSRLLEIARGVVRNPGANEAFRVHFISEGGEFESLIEKAGFPLERLEPRITQEKIDYAYKVDRGEALGSVFSGKELIEKIGNELAFLRTLDPVAIVTGSYVSMPVTHRVLGVPLVWVVQSTWLEGFFKNGAGMTKDVHFRPLKKILDRFIYMMLALWMRVALLNPLNHAAKHYGVPGIRTMFEYFRGDLNLVAEPPDFTGAQLPEDYRFIGPVTAHEDFPIPAEVRNIARDRPIVYFAMGSSGTPEIVAKILESFEGRPYRVIAPVRSLLRKVPGVKVPDNVILTDWLPAHRVNPMADISVIHGGVGTIMTAAAAGKPIVGVGMQPEQTSNLSAIAKKGFAIRVPKSRDPSALVQAAVAKLLADDGARAKAEAFAKELARFDGPALAARALVDAFAPQSLASDC
jgi:UDP:flavonoid glycosyltransferase YjiC (YdhE family)